MGRADNRLITSVKVFGRMDCCYERFYYLEIRIGSVDSLREEGTGSQLLRNERCGDNSGDGPR